MEALESEVIVHLPKPSVEFNGIIRVVHTKYVEFTWITRK